MYRHAFMPNPRGAADPGKCAGPSPGRKFLARLPQLLAALFLCVANVPAANAQDIPMIGELKLLPYNFCPMGWVEADGRLLAIATNDALFLLIGTTYGGDGITTFGVPDLRGRVPVGVGQAPGLSYINLGQRRGAETVTLTAGQMPQHSHTLQASTAAATHAAPASDRVLAATQNAGSYAAASASTPLKADSVGSAGGSQPVSVVNPGLGLLWCIALQGYFPSHP